MGTPDNKLSELVDIVKSWIPRRTEPTNVSRDFWMPDNSCRVCYDCDSQFTVFNRRHHCRLCGRVFCAKCTSNTIPSPSDEPKIGREDSERIRVCNYCFKQWEQGVAAAVEDGTCVPSPGLSPSPSATSLASTKSSCTCNSSNSTVGSTPYSTGPYQRVTYSCGLSPCQSAEMDPDTIVLDNIASARATNSSVNTDDVAPDKFGFCINSVRSDDEDDGYSAYHSDLETRHFSQNDDYYGDVSLGEALHKDHPTENNGDTKNMSSSLLAENHNTEGVEEIKRIGEGAEEHHRDHGDECETPLYDVEGRDAEPVDFESNGLLWVPPEPEDEEDEREAVLFDDDDDDDGVTGEWGYLRSSNSFVSRESSGRDKSSEEHKKAIKNVVEGHFRALVAQLLQVENLPVGDEDDKESWLEIITSLSWEAATLLKPDMSKGGGMDPGGYVKVKCIACGRRSESMVVRGVVCKKNVAHRRMTSKIDKPRFLILGGALEYQRVSNLLSSFDTLLQQEMDHLKMAVAKIDSHHPSVLLVEKSVSRYAQEYLLAKDISLVLNIKRPLLERIARCTGAQIVPSIDHLTSQKLGYCDTFHVEKFFEAHGSAGQGGKKLTKTLMFFEGCPRPLGCTILLKGASGDELKKVKHVVQYGIFAAYHLALETSFLADEGASLPELPLKSPITVALPNKPSSIDRSISIIPGFAVPMTDKPSSPQLVYESQKSSKDLISDGSSSSPVDPICKMGEAGPEPGCLSKGTTSAELAMNSIGSTGTVNSWPPTGLDFPVPDSNECPSDHDNNIGPKEFFWSSTADDRETVVNDDLTPNSFGTLEAFGQSPGSRSLGTSGLTVLEQDSSNLIEEMGSLMEEFHPSSSDHQSILVSLSTRCVWKGTVCERAHLLRIKYYGNFDKPLGRYLRDHLFDQSFRCHSCELPSEAHVHCYTHRQGSLTISVKKFGEFVLPGEREGKIWMWHRCLRCPRSNGFPPATKRVVMSDAAWGLSFGKFLELSFSNHAAASRVASCGHSLHRDCLRFYGFGRMVACFRYASIDVYSVYLPPPKLDFNHDYQEWLQTEANEVHEKEEQLFTEVYNAIHRVFSEKESGVGLQGSGSGASETRCCVTELEGILQKEKEELKESSQKINRQMKRGEPAVDILEINRLRRQLIFLSYVWDQRLVHVANSCKNNLKGGSSRPSPKSVEKVNESDVGSKTGKGSNMSESLNGGKAGQISQHGIDMDLDTIPRKETDPCLSSTVDLSDNIPSEDGNPVRRDLSEGESQIMTNLSDTLDAAWTGEFSPASMTTKDNGFPSSLVNSAAENSDLACSPFLKDPDSLEKSKILEGMPYMNLYSSLKYSVLNHQKLGLGEYSPVYVNLLREFERQSGARLLLPVGVNDTVVPVYDDEPTSIISYALVSSDYHAQMSEPDRLKESGELTTSFSSMSLFDSVNLMSMHSSDELGFDSYRSQGSIDENMLSMSGSRSSQVADPLLYTKDLHARVSIVDEGPLGKVKYTVTCYYAKRFEALRRICCPSELDYIRSLSRCKKWGAQGGKSNVFFAKTLDDRFIIKQVTKTELESFIKFASAYFKYLSESISTKSPTCLAKVLGIYQVSKQLKGGKETKMDVLVMENLLFRRNIVRLYDLKGSSRSRYNPDTSGSNKVLLDQNLIEAMPTSPIFVGNKAKRLLERAVWNDTSFLASIDVMDYSLLVGVDEEKHELVLGIIDFMRQYTWDKHLETWVKTSGILGGPKNTAPTVISPQQYKKRFRKAMTAYFLMVPDQWSPPRIIPSASQSDLLFDEQGGSNLDS